MDYEKEFADRAVAERQAQYSDGTRIEYIADDEVESGIPQGTKGTVDFVDDTGTIFAEFDNGKTVSLTYADRDKARVMTEAELAAENNPQTDIETDRVSEKLAKDLRFVWNGMKINGKLYKGSYSMGPYTPASNLPSGTISIYMDTATSYIPRNYAEIRGLSIENDTDIMTDYFDNDTVRITPDCICYKEALKGFVDMRIHGEKRAVKQYSSLFASHLGTHLEAHYAAELARHRQELASLEKANGKTKKHTAPQR